MSDVYPTADCGTSMAYEFIQLLESAGFNVHVEMYAPNGKYVHDDPNNSNNIGHCNSTITESYINSRQWDYVVVQDNAGAYMWAEGYMSSFVPAAQKTLHDKIIANNPCTKEILYSTQGYIDGLPSSYWNSGGLNLTYDDNIESGERSYRNHLVINDYYPLHIVSPAGLAWNRYCSNGHSKNDLYYDTAHPTDKASFLNAAVIFATIFKMEMTNITYTGGYSDAAYLKQIAYETVMDNTTFFETNLDTYTPEVNFALNEISVNNTYSSYQWYLCPNQIPNAENQSYTINETGLYFVEVEDANGCKLRSKVEEFDFITSVEKLTQNKYRVYPNPANNFIVIEDKRGNLKSIEICDISGKVLKKTETALNKVKVDISDLEKGSYFIVINYNDNETKVEKLIKR